MDIKYLCLGVLNHEQEAVEYGNDSCFGIDKVKEILKRVGRSRQKKKADIFRYMLLFSIE